MIKMTINPCFIMVLFSFIISSIAFSKDTVPTSNTKRGDVPKKHQWKPEHIFSSDQEWESAYAVALKDIPEIRKYHGKISKSGKSLLSCLKMSVDLVLKVSNIYAYAQYKNAGDEAAPKEKGMYDRAKMLATEFSKATAFIEPEILSMKDSKLSKFIKENKGLEVWNHYFDALNKTKKHILSEKEENLLAAAGDIFSKPSDIFQSFKTNVKFPMLKDEKGEEIQLNFTNFSSFRESNDPRVRKENAQKFFKTLDDYLDTFASTLDFAVKKNVYLANVRKYDSSLGAALESNFFTNEVYNNLTKAVYDKLGSSLHKYIEMRAKALKQKKLFFHDLYNPLVPSYAKEYSYDEGRELISESLKPLGKEYVDAFNLGSDPKNGWVDVYPNKHKHDGAYASEVWKVHPYILLNFQGRLDDISTVAHEYGHGLHYYFAEKEQPYIYSDVETMSTEVAAILNELLLLDYLIKKSENTQEKLYLLNRRLEVIRLTFFRQILFAEFERKIHEEVEAKQPLTAKKLKAIYSELITKFYGPHFAMSDNDGTEWAYIPHFYYNFYVWKYAAGIATAAALSDNILQNKPGAKDKYLNYLKLGSSDYPMNLLKKAGVDLTKKQTYTKIIDIFGETLKEFERLYFKK